MRSILEVLLVAFFHVVDGKECSYFKNSKDSLIPDGSCMDCVPGVAVLLCADRCASQVQCTAFVHRKHLYSTQLSARVGSTLHSTSFQKVHTGSLQSRNTSSENEITLIVSGSGSPTPRSHLAAFGFQSYEWKYFESESPFKALVYHPGDGMLYFSSWATTLFSCAWKSGPSRYNTVQTFRTTQNFAMIVTLALDVKENFLFVLIRHGKGMYEPATLVQVVRFNLKQKEQDAVVNRTGEYTQLGNNLAVDSLSRCLFLALNGEIRVYTYDLTPTQNVLRTLAAGVPTPLGFDGQLIYIGHGTEVVCLKKGDGKGYKSTDACSVPADDKNITNIIATRNLVVYIHDDGSVVKCSEGKCDTLQSEFSFVSVAALVAQ